jgi:hypothetical protein
MKCADCCLMTFWGLDTCSLDDAHKPSEIRKPDRNCVRNKKREAKLCEQLGITPSDFKQVERLQEVIREKDYALTTLLYNTAEDIPEDEEHEATVYCPHCMVRVANRDILMYSHDENCICFDAYNALKMTPEGLGKAKD